MQKLLAILLALIIITAPTLAFLMPTGVSSEFKNASLSSLEQQVLALVNGTRAYNYDLELEEISFRYPAFRSAGSAGTNETANWIKEKFDSFGLNATLEPFEFTTWNLTDKPSLIIDEDGNQTTLDDQTVIISFQCEHYSWPTPDDGIFGDLAVLPLPQAADHTQIGANPINTTEWNAIDTTGKIVLIGREIRWNSTWQQTFRSKLIAQTPAAVVYTWWYSWMNFTPQFYASTGGRPLGTVDPYYWNLNLSVGFVDYYDGLWIRDTEKTSPNLSANVSIRSVIDIGTHYNVVGRINGYTNPEKLVIISGHYDTVMCSGFCDNGAGTSGVIELAKVFAEAAQSAIYRPNYTLVFVAFAGEELDLVGSINYIRQHKSETANITAVINLDCIGNNDLYVTETEPGDEFDLDQIITVAAQDLGVAISPEATGGSDQEAFRIPSAYNNWHFEDWGLDANISDATPVKSSAMLDSYPLFYSDLWNRGTAGWIHTAYDNSTSTATLGWVQVSNLENHIKVAALAVMRISPNALIPEFPSVIIIALLIATTLLASALLRTKRHQFSNKKMRLEPLKPKRTRLLGAEGRV